jgi:hypothetical protein
MQQSDNAICSVRHWWGFCWGCEFRHFFFVISPQLVAFFLIVCYNKNAPKAHFKKEFETFMWKTLFSIKKSCTNFKKCGIIESISVGTARVTP